MHKMELINTKKRPLRIAVDIATLTDGKTGKETSGIQTAVIALLHQLQRIDVVNDYLLFETIESVYTVNNPRWKKVLLPAFRIPRTMWAQLVFPFYLLKYKVDVLWAPKYICPLWHIRKMKVFTTVYDLGFLHFPQTLLTRDRLIMRLLVPLSARRSTAVFTDSEYIKRDFKENFRSIKTPVIAVPLGRPEWQIPSSYSLKQRQDFLFFPGNLDPRKNLLNAVKALEILYAQGKIIKLHISSPSIWKSGEVIDYINKSPVKGSITFLGFIPLDELKKKYLTCKALLYPSIYEGFGLPVLEALAMDCPVLTSKNTVMQEIAGESAVYFNPLDPGDIAEKISFVYSDVFDRNVYFRHKDRALEKYSWETAARIMFAAFESPAGK
jgi:glycosyltransferase involved in cell wall biosynthesis